jgi:phosphoribosylformylglycinamidine synthase
MIFFFGHPNQTIFAVSTQQTLDASSVEKLTWLFGNLPKIEDQQINGEFFGPRAAMVTPWSTNAVEITQNMGIHGIERIEQYWPLEYEAKIDPMLAQIYKGLDQDIFKLDITPEAIKEITDIQAYNLSEGLALSEEEVDYLNDLAKKLERPLTDSEVFGFSQVNSEHCRHKIFNGTFIIDGETKDESLFSLIKKTSKTHPNGIVSAYKDNVAFLSGPKVTQFAPSRPDQADFFDKKSFDSIISLKAETHNFPTTVEPFNGAATGSGGEIRDRLAGGKGSIPLAGTAVYMTAYSRVSDNRAWENQISPRPWLYQTPLDILIKASNGASDFGNKFGQPLICGSVLTFEHQEQEEILGFDKVIMLAGGIGYGKAQLAQKDKPKPGDRIVVMGGDNYRIGMGGAAVSSADTGAFSSGIELNAIQRSNPEMQKRTANAIRALVESDQNPIVSIHDHGAGGHLNCLSELIEETGGHINLDKLPIGDPTLSAKEIIGNESQERMGLVIDPKDLPLLEKIAERERAPLYDVGEVTSDHKFVIQSENTGARPMDFDLGDMFGSSPKTIMTDQTEQISFSAIHAVDVEIYSDLEAVLCLEAVGCKDWLTNKVDRCVGGLVAKQQCTGALQLPLNNCGVMALDYEGTHGIATSVGHSPVAALIDPVAGSRNAVVEALTNIIWAPLSEGLKSVSLSANWMWPANNPGENARLYNAVKGISDFALALGINIPTGKDSLSMKQKYPGQDVKSPGTVIVSAAAHCNDISGVVEPNFKLDQGPVYYINLSGMKPCLGGSSWAQTKNKIGNTAPDVCDAAYLANAFNAVQELIKQEQIVAGHDIASGGLITTLLEMCFSSVYIGAQFDMDPLTQEVDLSTLLFAENTGIVIQVRDEQNLLSVLNQFNISAVKLGSVVQGPALELSYRNQILSFDIAHYRDVWYHTSYLMDQQQTAAPLAMQRYEHYKNQPLTFNFPDGFSGKLPESAYWSANERKITAAIIREKGSNSEREMAHALYLAGFKVKDIHMTDLISGRETLEDVQFIGAVGGFSNSDVLGSAKGWAGAFRYNEKAKQALNQFFQREDTLSVGICNGCQLFLELDLINPEHEQLAKMRHNNSKKHESNFTSVTVQKNNSVMLSELEGTTLGVWISHGEGRFDLPMSEDHYGIVAKYAYSDYPANPNGSDYNTAMMCDPTGRHLVTMPHIERSIFQWNWAHYPNQRKDEVSPWLTAFVNARKWLEKL